MSHEKTANFLHFLTLLLSANASLGEVAEQAFAIQKHLPSLAAVLAVHLSGFGTRVAPLALVSFTLRLSFRLLYILFDISYHLLHLTKPLPMLFHQFQS